METKDFKWYVVKTISGKEEKVKTYIEKELEHNKMDKHEIEKIILVKVPTQIYGELRNIFINLFESPKIYHFY